MSESNNLTYYQRNKDMILSKPKDYYKNNNERLKKYAKDKYRNLSEEDKNKKGNMEKIEIIICLKKKAKIKRIPKKKISRKIKL